MVLHHVMDVKVSSDDLFEGNIPIHADSVERVKLTKVFILVSVKNKKIKIFF